MLNETQKSVRAVVLLPKLQVSDANMISGPLTWGFPAITAFTGFAYALALKLKAQDVRVNGIGIACHDYQMQVTDGYVKSLNLRRLPMGADGAPSALVEEGRCHFTVSLLLDIEGDLPVSQAELRQQGDAQHPTFIDHLVNAVGAMRLAGGSVRLGPQKVSAWLKDAYVNKGEQLLREITRRLAPARLLVGRNDLMSQHLQHMRVSSPSATALDALLDIVAIHHECEPTGKVTKTGEPGADWTSQRRHPGWLVPMPMGYSAISELYAPGQVKNVRDLSKPVRFVESLTGLCEWIHPRHVRRLDQMLWRHDAHPDEGLYLVRNDYAPELAD